MQQPLTSHTLLKTIQSGTRSLLGAVTAPLLWLVYGSSGQITFLFEDVTKNLLSRSRRNDLAWTQHVRATAGSRGTSVFFWVFLQLNTSRSGAQIQSDRRVRCFLTSVSHVLKLNTDWSPPPHTQRDVGGEIKGFCAPCSPEFAPDSVEFLDLSSRRLLSGRSSKAAAYSYSTLQPCTFKHSTFLGENIVPVLYHLRQGNYVFVCQSAGFRKSYRRNCWSLVELCALSM